MSELGVTPSSRRHWPRRNTLVGLCFCSTFICYIDRVNISVTIIPMSQELGWDPARQGIALSAFFVGYLLTQIVGGRMADRYGGKIVLGLAVLLWSFFTILTPPAAYLGFAALLLARIAMGVGEGVTFPSVYSMFARWVPARERTRAFAFNASGIPLGTVFALLATPWIVIHWGWQWAFYAFGAAGVVWYGFWQWKAAATPSEHRTMSQRERDLIHREASVSEYAPTPPSWRELLSCRPMWAIIVAHFSNNWALYVLLTWLPTYVVQGLGVDFEVVGLYAMMPQLSGFICLNMAGWVTDKLIMRGLDVTFVRKLMQTIGFGGIAIALLLIGQVESAVLAITVMTIGNGIGAFAVGGFGVNHLDIAPRHAGTLMGLSNTVATIPGIVGVYITGLILAWTNSWAIVFGVTAGVILFGLVFYLIFASGKRVFD